ncbi:M20 family metallopeptidase [Paenibacillus sp. 2RAB27]|uniref:M20 family metallopeptidase n=1 Tax=Paenibacillus sp. 2RAB27 TaxID=3232991 RepID=UPI003F96E38E
MELETLSRRIGQWVQTNREEAVELAQCLVRIESVNHPPHGNERAFQHMVAEWLRSEGAEVEVYDIRSVPGLEAHPGYMQGRDYADRPNVVGRFRGEGGGRSLMFSSHADTVHEGRKPWRFPPFSGVIENDKLYGRGAYDMKGGLAASLMAIRCLRDLGVKLKGDVIAESVVDEEYGGSNGALAARLHGPDADMAIIPEPSNLKLYPAHLGGGAWKAAFTGKNGIVFNGEQIVNALDAAVDFVRLLREFGDHLRNRYPAPELWRSSKEAEVATLKIVTGDPNREVTEMSDTGEVRFWIEGYPGMTGDGIIGELWSFYESRLDAFPILRSCRPVITPMIRYLEASALPDDERSRTFLEVAASAGERSLGKPCGEPMGAPFTCDAFMFNLYSSTPALVLGPTGGNAHAPDEYLDIDSYLSLIAWYAELTAEWCGICAMADREVKA